MPQLISAFVTVFFIFGLGFSIQRLWPLGEQTLTQLSSMVVNILLPCYLFFTTATSSSTESVSVAPLLTAMGIVVPFCSYLLASLALKPSRVTEEQRPAFRFSILVANTAFLGIPICEILFGPLGVVYAVLYDFGTTLITLTLGVWELSGGRLDNWRPLLFNPLIWSVVAGMLWALTGWPVPGWLAAPFETLGDATLPLALLVGGALVGDIRSQTLAWRQQLTGLTFIRLVATPLIVSMILLGIDQLDLAKSVIIVQAAMPVGLTPSIMAKAYGADAQFAASATLWSTLASMLTLPLVALLLVHGLQL